MTNFTAWIERARAVDIGDVVLQRGLKLRGRGHAFEGACPVCGGTDRFAVNLRKQAFNCRACEGHGYGAISLMMFIDGSDFLDAVEAVTGEPPPKDAQFAATSNRIDNDAIVHERQERAAAYAKRQAEREAEERRERERMAGVAAKLWDQRLAIAEDSPPGLYLRRRGFRGIIPPTLGYLPASGKHPPAMIAAFAIVDEFEPGVIDPPQVVRSVHLTRLTPDGHKHIEVDERGKELSPKRILGDSLGLPIVLAPPNDALAIGFTEGIENGLSVLQRLGMGVWAAGTANRLPALAATIPGYVECASIFADSDKAGMENAKKLARLLTEGKIETRLLALREN